MSIYRSAEMKFYHLFIPKQDTYDVINDLAEYDFVQFIDASSNTFHRPYFNSVKRCEDVVVKIQLINRELNKHKISLPDIPVVEVVLRKVDKYIKDNKLSSMSFLDKIEDQVNDKYHSLEKATKTLIDFEQKIVELEDQKYLLFKAREIFHSKKDEAEIYAAQLRLINVSGIIYSKDILKFTKMIFRATKGNSILYTFNIPIENENDAKNPRTAFICIIQSGDSLLNKINRICDSFMARKYTLPTNKDEVFDKIKVIEDSITDTKQLCVMAEKNLKENLYQTVEVSGDLGCGKFDAYRVLFQKQILIFNTMNFLEETTNVMIAKVWVPAQKSGMLYHLVSKFVSIRQVQSSTSPPTYFESNSFTMPFQEIVYTYGIPRYQQINPALYAIPVFPFLFGIMFGDIGHGGLVLAFSLWLLLSASAKKVVPSVYEYRYLFLLMGMSAFYAGWIYNEFFSIPLNIFGTCYSPAEPQEYSAKEEGCVYPIGFDPKWIRASNQLNYFNSFKMKFAVIIGVFQMTFAIFLKMLNTLHFKSYLDFFFEWIPQQLFFLCTFGYMCLLIIVKWTIPWGVEVDTSTAPSIIGQMIALPLKMGSTEGKPLWDIQSQQSLQYHLLLISLICVPWMLLPKPFFIWLSMPKHKPRQRMYSNHEQQLDEDLLSQSSAELSEKKFKEKKIRKTAASEGEHHGQEHDISEVAVHQIIQTIEFILGSISNTASYLRLWALSLAHGQLSRVFLQKTIGGGIQSANTIVIVIGMYLFFNITLGVIMGMDVMQCFLHALRLQWVQFQSKFYKADGWKFVPLAIVGPLQLKIDSSRAND